MMLNSQNFNSLDYIKPYIESYRYKFLNLSFTELVQTYKLHEQEIRKDIVEVVSSFLIQSGFQKKENLYARENEFYNFLSAPLLNTRKYYLTFHSIEDNLSLIEKSIEINKFGLIKEVIIEYPINSKIDFKFLSKIIKDLFISAYNALETAFENSSQKLSKELFNSIHNIFRIQLKDNGKEYLNNKVIFTLFNEKEGYQFFDKFILRDIINHFKDKQDIILSPIELTIWFMTESIPFPKTLSIEAFRQDKTLLQSWKKAKFKLDTHKYYQSALKFHESNDYGVYPICNIRNNFLIIIFKESIAKDIIPEIELTKDMITLELRNSLKSYSKFIKMIKRISNTIKGNKNSQFIGDVIGNAAYTLWERLSGS